MSVEVVLAIVPICLSALHGISIVRKKIRIVRQYDREIDGIRRKVETQTENFQHELMRVLAKSLEARGSTVLDWAEFLTHGEPSKVAPEWASKGEEIETAMREYLGEKFNRLHGCIKDVRLTTDMMYKELNAFDVPDGKAKWKVAKNAVRIAFNKSQYIEQIDNLKDINEAIKQIRVSTKLMRKYKSPAPPPYSAALADQATPAPPKDCTEVLLRQYKSSSKLLADFLTLLFDQWACRNGSHSRHVAHILLRCIQPRDGETSLGLLLGWVGQQGLQSFQWKLPILVTRQYSALPSPPLDIYTSFEQVGAMDQDGPASKRLRTLADGDSGPQSGLCQFFNQASVPTPLGDFSIERTNSFEFEGGPGNLDAAMTGQMTPLFNLLSLPVYEVVSDRHRITVALMLVRAMLKFHSTKCWPKRCLLSEVKFYRTSEDHDIDLAKCLDTLHISVDIDPHPPSGGDVDMENGPKCPSSPEQDGKDWVTHGIQNPFLYNLGVALLQIGLWKQVKWDDFERVRHKAANLSYLGESYHKLTRRLINGNLGSGESNLTNPKLQEAVIRDVASGLQKLLKEMNRGLP